MALADVEIPAVLARTDLTPREKQREIYRLKVEAIADWLINGKPAPNPLPPALGRTYTLNGVSYTTDFVKVEDHLDGEGVPVKVLRVEGRAVKAGFPTKTFQLRIVNPPILTKDRREHYIDAAAEIVEGAVRWP